MTENAGPDPRRLSPTAHQAGPAGPLVLLVSVWFETPDRRGFRARVSATGTDGALATRHVTADPDSVPAAVAGWLADLLMGTGPAPDDS